MNTEQLCILTADADSERLCRLLNEYMPAKIDCMGNVTGKISGNGSYILLDAHSDCVGLVVTAVDSDGFIKFDRYGGADLRVLTGCEVTVYGKKQLFGVISSVPPHLIKDSSKSREISIGTLAVDVGLSYDEVSALVSSGDRIQYRSRHFPLGEHRLCGTYFDDRCGIAAILLCLERLRQNGISKSLEVQFTVGEERGKAGAKTACFDSEADFCIAVDVGFARQPFSSAEDCTVLGGGASVGYSPVTDRAMSDKLMLLAREKNIPVQCDATGGLTHTNADEIAVSKSGKKCALLSIPLRSMHTGCEVLDVRDVEATAALLYEYIKEEAENNGCV